MAQQNPVMKKKFLYLETSLGLSGKRVLQARICLLYECPSTGDSNEQLVSYSKEALREEWERGC
jgi:hypothetical protein